MSTAGASTSASSSTSLDQVGTPISQDLSWSVGSLSETLLRRIELGHAWSKLHAEADEEDGLLCSQASHESAAEPSEGWSSLPAPGRSWGSTAAAADDAPRRVAWHPDAVLQPKDTDFMENDSEDEDELHRALLQRRPAQADMFQRLSTGRYNFRGREVELKILDRVLVVSAIGGQEMAFDSFLESERVKLQIEKEPWPPTSALTSPRGELVWIRDISGNPDPIDSVQQLDKPSTPKRRVLARSLRCGQAAAVEGRGQSRRWREACRIHQLQPQPA